MFEISFAILIPMGISIRKVKILPCFDTSFHMQFLDAFVSQGFRLKSGSHVTNLICD